MSLAANVSVRRMPSRSADVSSGLGLKRMTWAIIAERPPPPRLPPPRPPPPPLLPPGFLNGRDPGGPDGRGPGGRDPGGPDGRGPGGRDPGGPDGRGPEVAIPAARMVADPEVAIRRPRWLARKDGIPAALLVAARTIAAPGGRPPGGRELPGGREPPGRPAPPRGFGGCPPLAHGARPRGFPAPDPGAPGPRGRGAGRSPPGPGDAAPQTGPRRAWACRFLARTVDGPGGRAAGPRGARGPVGGAGRSRSGEPGSSPGGVLSPSGRSRRSLAAKRRRFSSRGTLKRSRGSSCVPPGRQDGPRRSPPPRREAARSSSGDSHRRPLANHFSWISACRACSCLKVGRSSSRVCARKDVGLPSRMIVQ